MKLKRYKLEVIDFDRMTREIEGVTTFRTKPITFEKFEQIIKERVGSDTCYRWTYLRRGSTDV